MDIKELIEKAVDKIKDDDAMQAQFKKDPIKALEKLLGIDLPDDIMEKGDHPKFCVNLRCGVE